MSERIQLTKNFIHLFSVREVNTPGSLLINNYLVVSEGQPSNQIAMLEVTNKFSSEVLKYLITR